GPFNTALTLVSIVIIVALAWPTVKFLFIDAVWTGSSRLDCLSETVGREVGACWPFIKAKFAQFMYGFYPASQQWRLAVSFALGRRSQLPIVRTVSIIFIEFWRGVPLITVLFFATYMLPLFLPDDWRIDALARVLIGVVLFAGAYMAEVVRGGLQAIPRGQFE